MTSILDTTVLVFAVLDRHDLREPAVALVQAVAAGAIHATTTPEAIQGFTQVRARRRGRADASQLAERYADLGSPLLEITEDELREGLALYRDAEQLGSFDAVLAAASRRRGATLILSRQEGALTTLSSTSRDTRPVREMVSGHIT